MKAIFLSFLLFISFSFNFASASSLYNNFEVYQLSEVLHGARYDYEGGVSFKLKDSYGSYKRAMRCHDISKGEIIMMVEQAIDLYMSAYGEEEFDLYRAVKILDRKLSALEESIGGFSECFNSNGESYFRVGSKFLMSINPSW